MVHLNVITTRTGDDGTTGLVGGRRVPKHHRRVEAMGTVDEVNAVIGLVRTLLPPHMPEADMLEQLQHDLFDLGADLATPKASAGALRIVSAQVATLETRQAGMNAHLDPLTSFVLPGGSPASAYLHLARTLARRAERTMTALDAEEGLNPEALRYINRLSDFLFVLARWCNDHGRKDVLWQPGAGRQQDA